MTRASVQDSTAGLGHTLRAGRPLVGGVSFHGVSGLCMNSLVQRLPGVVQAQSVGLLWRSAIHLRPARQALGGMIRRPMQAWVSCSGGRKQLLVVHTP